MSILDHSSDSKNGNYTYCCDRGEAVCFDSVALATPLTGNQTPGVGFPSEPRARLCRSGRRWTHELNQNCAITAVERNVSCLKQEKRDSCHYPPTGTFPAGGTTVLP
jgi:hypothetical protein